ncbi:MAG TPA: DUF2279 domain-containing protein [Phnomibacter sp.]|nr:DUF2279 domain-containing protein [Phnomibacter sp.]
MHTLASRINRSYTWVTAVLLVMAMGKSLAQSVPDTLAVEIIRAASLDTIIAVDNPGNNAAAPDSIIVPNKKRVWTVVGAHTALYGGTLLALNQAWYANYPRGSFHTFNDSKEWLQVDKVGHAWTAYQLGRASMASWAWAGLPPKKQAIYGSLSGFAFLTVIEVLDGFSAEWGWSWSDIAANTLGSGFLLSQQLGWQEQRISFKYSFHGVNHAPGQLQNRANQLFGSGILERMLKDYNGQTYWLSANVKSFFKQSKLPAWLNIAVGYGATGMYGGTQNIWTDKQTGQQINRTDIARRREWYLAPDVDFTKIPTRNKFVKTVFFCLNALKMPSPALAFSNGKFTLYGFYF